MTVSTALFLAPAYEAEIVTDVFLRDFVVVTVKVFDIVPAATTTIAGTEARVDFELPSVTVAPLAGAGSVSVTVPIADPPPTTLTGFSAIAASAGGGAETGLTVRVVVFVTPPYVAETVLSVCVVTAVVVMPKLAVLAP